MYKSYCGNYSTNFLEGLVIMEDPKYGYKDPDGGYKIKDNEYYANIVKFLKKREEDVLKGEWTYEVIKDKGIEVKEGNDHIFYLRSDQFGFSAPQISTSTKFLGCDNRYPYWRYLHLSTHGSKYWKVIEWINITRTIGGSFVWPVWKENKNSDYYSRYNRYRGVKSYIEDSVDLTLYEVKRYYDHKDNYNKNNEIISNDKLYTSEFDCFENNPKECPMKKWLDHFGNFEKYAKFFMFDDDFEEDEVADGILDDENFGGNRKIDELKKYVFCQKNETEGKEHKYYPIDILIGNPLKENKVEDYKKTRRIKNCSVKELEIVLDRLSKMTILRTARILEAIKNIPSEKSSQS